MGATERNFLGLSSDAKSLSSLPIPSIIALLFFAILPFHLHSQTTTQEITFNPGWNAVWLEILPEPNDTESVFFNPPEFPDGLSVSEIWTWKDRTSTAEFVQDLGEIDLNRAQWLRFFPTERPESFLNNLLAIADHKPYFIRFDGMDPVTFTVSGRPSVETITWTADTFNLFGFPIDATNPPSFSTYFAGSPAHHHDDGNLVDVYALSGVGRWLPVGDPENTAIVSGAAYWVFCRGGSNYSGSLRIEVGQQGSLDYSRTLQQLPLVLENISTDEKIVTLEDVNDPNPAMLAYYNLIRTPTTQEFVWDPLPSLHEITLQPGQRSRLRLAILRKNLTPENEEYNSVLKVVDNSGLRFNILVTAQSRTTMPESGDPNHPHAGLWVGAAIINEVSQRRPPQADIGFDLELAGEVSVPFELVSLGSVWKFDDSGIDQGTAWRDADFNDSTWSSGRGRFGYGARFLAKGEGEEIWVDKAGGTVTRYDDDNNERVFFGRQDPEWSTPDDTAGANTGIYYHDSDGDGAYTDGEDIWKDGFVLNDRSGNDFRADMIGGEQTSPDGMVGFGHALELNGIDQYGDVQNSAGIVAALQLTAWTLEAWIKTPATGVRREVVYFGASAVASGVAFYVGADEKLHLDFAGVAGPASSAIVGDDAWHHVAAAYDRVDGLIRLYVDGMVQNQQTMPVLALGPGVFRIGQSESGTDAPFSGLIDDLRIWNVERDAALIAAAMDVPLVDAGNTAELVAYWDFDHIFEEGADLRIFDGGDGWQATGGALGSQTGLYFHDADSSGDYTGAEATTLSFGSDANNKSITTYFRKEFDNAGIFEFNSLAINLLTDAGAAVYLNGIEIFRHNMPAGVIRASTPAIADVAGVVDDGQFASSATIPRNTLKVGSNLLAVEIHRHDSDGDDLTFDMDLSGIFRDDQVLVPARSAWIYHDTGVDAGTLPAPDWKDPGFVPDVTWKGVPDDPNDPQDPNLAFGEFGFGNFDSNGDAQESTHLNPEQSGEKVPAFYFRKEFDVPAGTLIHALEVRLLRDDGAVVYLNGTEVSRSNMPTETAIEFDTSPVNLVNGDDEIFYQVIDVRDDLLIAGAVNVLAVEVHQHVVETAEVSLIPTPTAAEFDFPLLIHVNNGGSVRLLKEVIQMWQDPPPDEPDEPGQFVLVTNEEEIVNYSGATLRDGVPVGRRISTAAYDFSGHSLEMTGNFAIGQTVTGVIELPANFPTNPFKHKFHPDHDNLDALYEPLPSDQLLVGVIPPLAAALDAHGEVQDWGSTVFHLDFRAGDDWDPAVDSIFIDEDGNNTFTPGTDIAIGITPDMGTAGTAGARDVAWVSIMTYDANNDSGDFNIAEDAILIPGRSESYDISRTMELTFASEDPSSQVTVDFGESVMGGIFEETIRGLHNEPIRVKGIFRLELATKTGVLIE